ncbi:MAG: hypothetical protein H6Q69_1685 [Firmicutes bacterium]|nr:hypothetical protein [Bacillota bacterium]
MNNLKNKLMQIFFGKGKSKFDTNKAHELFESMPNESLAKAVLYNILTFPSTESANNPTIFHQAMMAADSLAALGLINNTREEKHLAAIIIQSTEVERLARENIPLMQMVQEIEIKTLQDMGRL